MFLIRFMQPVRAGSLMLLAAALIGRPAAIGAEVAIDVQEGKAVVTIDGKPFTEYVFSGHAKPILYPIIGPTGVTMTRNYPMQEGIANEASDHPHHKSLWFTHDDVNGVQFWMEYPRKGAEKQPGKILQTELKVEGDSIVSTNAWTASDGKVVCVDSRSLTFGANDVGRFIDFTITLKPTGEEVIFGDTKEGTMGIRMNPLLRLKSDERRGNTKALGKAVNSEGVSGGAVWGKRAKWVDYWAPIEGETVGIAIFDHPDNPRHPTWWHAREYGLVAANPFGVHDFEGKPKGTGDMKITSGEPVTFRYRFLFHRGDSEQADIDGQYDLFAK